MSLLFLILIPFLTAVAIIFIPEKNIKAIKLLSAAAISACFVICLILWFTFDPAKTSWQFIINLPWIPQLGINFYLGLDGLSLPLMMLTALIFVIIIIYVWDHREEPRKFFSLLMLLLGSLFGVFSALDIFLFYVFFEASLVPMYFMIGIWGYEQRIYAAIKFFLYTLAGSMALLLGILIIYFKTNPASFAIADLQAAATSLSPTLALIAFFAFFIGFAIKLPLFPFHTWLPLAHREAPTAGSVILAALLLKIGGYGFFRFLIPFFGIIGAQYSQYIIILGVVSLIYGSLTAIAQTDLKKMIAYSSIGHMAYIVIAVAALFSATPNNHAKIIAFEGATLQMINHGLITGGLFIMAGMLYKRIRTYEMARMGGLFKAMPYFGGFFLLFCFASLGLPGLSGFIGEFLTLLGAFAFYKIEVAVALIGIILTAVYFLRAIQEVLMGMPSAKLEKTPDLSRQEIIVLLPLIILIIFIGLYPAPILNIISASNIVSTFK